MTKAKTKKPPALPSDEVVYRRRVISYSSPEYGIWANLLCTVSIGAACTESMNLLGISLPPPLSSAVRALCSVGKQLTIGLFELPSCSKIVLVDAGMGDFAPEMFVFYRPGSGDWMDMTGAAIIDVDGCEVTVERLSDPR